MRMGEIIQEDTSDSLNIAGKRDMGNQEVPGSQGGWTDLLQNYRVQAK